MSVGCDVNLGIFANYNGNYTIISVPSTTSFTVAYGSNEGSQTWLTSLLWDSVFPPGTEIKVEGSPQNDGFYTVITYGSGGTKLYVDASLITENTVSATITSLPKEDILVLLSDADNSDVDTYSKNKDTWTNAQVNVNPSDTTLENNSKIVY